MIIGLQSIVLYYQYFYRKKYNSPKYKFLPTHQAITKINTFLLLLDKKYDLNTLGKDFLSTYFIFQFNRTHNQVFKRFSSSSAAGKIQIYDIIGKKAFQYYLDRDVKFDYQLRQSCDFVKEHNVRVSEIGKELVLKVSKPVLRSEEIEKKRFFNTDRGLLNCIERTSLFNHRSSNCVLCKLKKSCKKVLEVNYPLIYKERGYEHTV